MVPAPAGEEDLSVLLAFLDRTLSLSTCPLRPALARSIGTKAGIDLQDGVLWQGKQGPEQKEDDAKEGAQKRRGTEESALRDISHFVAQMQDTKVCAFVGCTCFYHGMSGAC